jgi:hypothetical protein
MQKATRPATGIIGYINRRRRSNAMSSRKSNKGRRVGVIMIDASDIEQGDRCGRIVGYIFPRNGEGAFAGKEFLRAGNGKCFGFFAIDDAAKS